MVGDSYYKQLEASGGTSPYLWGTISGALPVGLSLDKAGTISGIPEQDGTSNFRIQATDAANKKSRKRTFSITINPKLTITTDLSPRRDLGQGGQNWIADLHAEGGAGDYTWTLTRGTTPPWLDLNQNGRITGTPDRRGTWRFTVQARDHDGHTATADFIIKVRRRLKHRLGFGPKMTAWSITVRPSWRERLLRVSLGLAFLAVALPISGIIWILFYAFSTPGAHLAYLGVAGLTALAAFLIGCLVGFLFGVPRMVSSGSLRLQTGTSGYTPSSNLAEVSDWLTKLLLGAGLVQLTHLGAPIASLIDHVGRGLGPSGSATVMAGAILLGYTAIGMLDGYVMTTTWYQNWLTKNMAG